ncbi:MAG TPA: ABC transporter permease [Candidatus Polarisedimenticolia bacterium]|nr:ABC transporter permease [Candidatus Polarisedimenticolia bacterium]
MRWIYKIPLRFRSLLHKRRVEHELNEEMRFHLEKLIEENVANGMSAEEARYAALREFGGIEQMKEECRDSWGVRFISELVQDVRFGFRMLRKNLGLTALAVFALAIGIGVNTAVFTAFNATLRPIQATDPGRVVAVYRSAVGGEHRGAFSYPHYLYFRDHNRSFAGLFAASGTEVSINDIGSVSGRDAPAGGATALLGIRFFQQIGSTAELGRAAMVSENYFSTLGINPVMGRSFAAGESTPVVMLSYNFWARRFQSDPSLVGKSLKLNGKPFTVIGITPKDFIGTYPNAPSVWLPISSFSLLEAGRDPHHSSNDQWCEIYGRLKSNVSKDQAQAELTVLADEFRQSYPPGPINNKPVTLSVEPAMPYGAHPSREAIMMLAAMMSAVGLVLLIACANVAGLQLARSKARRKEIGMRLALGASRRRLVQQLLTEASLLALMAGGAGLLASWFAERLLETSVAAVLPPVWGFLAINVNPDIRVFAYTLAVSFVTAILFGLAPALEASKPNLVSVWKEEGADFAGRLRGQRLLHSFIAAQVAICLVLLIAAGLLARGSARAVRLNPGFETKRILALYFEAPPGIGYDAARMATIVRRMIERFKTVPGVTDVAEGRVPLGGGLRTARVILDPAARQSNAPAPEFYYSYVSPNYFKTLSIPIIRGRTFTDAEARASAPVTVISEATAKKLWQGQDPIGKRFTLDASQSFHDPQRTFPSETLQVIGISEDMHSTWLNETDPSFLAIPLPPAQYGDVMIRAENDPTGLKDEVGRQAKEVDPNVIIYAETLDGLMTLNPGFVISRVAAVFSTIIGILGLLLAAVGIYGTVSYAVIQRTHEVGVRMALGATKREVLGLILRQSARPVVIGMLVGLAGSVAVSRLLSSLLFGISSLDPLAFLGVSLFLLSVSLIACYIPARRAAKVDPMVALRYE